MKRAAAVAVPATNAAVRLYREMPIVVGGQRIPGLCQIKILVDQADVQTGRARLAVVAVDTDPLHFPGGHNADSGIVPLFLGGFKKAEDPLEI